MSSNVNTQRLFVLETFGTALKVAFINFGDAVDFHDVVFHAFGPGGTEFASVVVAFVFFDVGVAGFGVEFHAEGGSEGLVADLTAMGGGFFDVKRLI